MNGAKRWATGLVGVIALANVTVFAAAASDPNPPVAGAAPRPLTVAANWQMNETGGSVMNDSGPSNIDGDIGDEVALNGSYYEFDIASPTQEYRPEHIVTVPDHPNLDPGSSDYAIEFRYRTRRSWGNLVQKGQNTTLGGYFKFEQPNGLMTCLFKWTNPQDVTDTDQIGVKAPPGMETNDGEWHTIRCELRRDFGVILFIDGVEAAKNAGSLPPIQNNKVVSIAGKASCNNAPTGTPDRVTCDYFDGDIDYVRIEKGDAAQNEPPNMEFTYDCDDFECTFDSRPSNDPDGSIVSRSWSFGDGTTGSGSQTSHTFPGPGEYTVTLRGTDNSGAVGVAEETLTIVANQPPQMAFTATCDVRACDFDASASTDPDGNIVAYSWQFGDGQQRLNDDDPEQPHTYASPGVYTVTLTGRDDDGAETTVSQDVAVDVNAPPTASFTVSCTLLACSVDGSASSDPDGTITSYAWTFGDGDAATGATADHTYSRPGTYTIGLTVTDDRGDEVSATRQVTVDRQASLPPTADATRLIALPPERVFDTREGEPAPGPKGIVTAGSTIEVDVTGVASIPPDAEAVAINITAIGDDPGFITAWPTGLPRPTASSINLTAPGQVRANLVIVPVGANGTISLYSLGDAHLLGDVAGYFEARTTATSAGRIVTQPPERIFDTRPGEPANGPKGLVPAGGTIEVDVLGESGVPASGVSAVVLTVTATAPASPGFVTVWSGEGDRPLASVVNLNNSGETVPNQVIVPVSASGTISFFSSTAVHLLADVSGYVTDSAAPSSTTGLFVPLTPDRLFDTRPGEAANGPKGQLTAGGEITPEIAGVAGVPATAGAVVLNLTMIGTAPSFATAWPAGGARPVASIVNVDGPDVRANGATIALGAGGDVSFFASAPAHLLADVSGYLLA
jgi:PKD repeat protein